MCFYDRCSSHYWSSWKNEGLVLELEQKINKLSGDELMQFILQDTKELKSTLLGPKNMGMLAIATLVPGWLNKKMVGRKECWRRTFQGSSK